MFSETIKSLKQYIRQEPLIRELGKEEGNDGAGLCEIEGGAMGLGLLRQGQSESSRLRMGCVWQGGPQGGMRCRCLAERTWKQTAF